MGELYGYVRVSSIDQNENRQRMAMHEHAIAEERIYTDKISGKNFQRPQYQAMLKRLQPGDQLCITSIDRLGRNYEEIQTGVSEKAHGFSFFPFKFSEIDQINS